MIESIQEEASEDFAAAMGAGVTENVRSPVWSSVQARLPWIAFDVLMSDLGGVGGQPVQRSSR